MEFPCCHLFAWQACHTQSVIRFCNIRWFKDINLIKEGMKKRNEKKETFEFSGVNSDDEMDTDLDFSDSPKKLSEEEVNKIKLKEQMKSIFSVVENGQIYAPWIVQELGKILEKVDNSGIGEAKPKGRKKKDERWKSWNENSPSNFSF